MPPLETAGCHKSNSSYSIQNPLNILPVELWLEVIKLLPSRILLKYRLVCTTFNHLAIDKVYKYYYVNFYKGAVKSENCQKMVEVYEHFEKMKAIQREIKAYNQFMVISNERKRYSNSAFMYACWKGNLEMLVQIYSWTEDEAKVQLIKFTDYEAFKIACYEGHAKVIEQIYNWSAEPEREKMIKANDFNAFKVASRNGHIAVVQKIYAWADEGGKTRMRSFREYDFLEMWS